MERKITKPDDEISPRTKVVKTFESLDRSLLQISLLPCISLLSDGEPIELDRLLDREGGSSPKLGMSLPPSRPCKLGQLSSFSSLSPLIEFHDISTNFPAVYRGICEAKIVETVWKWPSISPLATRNIVARRRATKILSLVNSSTSTLYISCSLERIGSETVRVAIRSGLLCIYFRILQIWIDTFLIKKSYS